MSALTDFLQRLVGQGSVMLRERPVTRPADRGSAAAWLKLVYADYRLAVAGPLLAFDASVALKAADCCRSACWFLVDHGAEDAEVEAELKMPDPSANPAEHLSADLVLRFLPQIYHRARAIAADDVLTRSLATVCRQWPLSGVLAGLDEGPTTTPVFGGHAGLQLLYAERFADNPRPAWLPAGRAEEYVNLVASERGESR